MHIQLQYTGIIMDTSRNCPKRLRAMNNCVKLDTEHKQLMQYDIAFTRAFKNPLLLVTTGEHSAILDYSEIKNKCRNPDILARNLLIK